MVCRGIIVCLAAWLGEVQGVCASLSVSAFLDCCTIQSAPPSVPRLTRSPNKALREYPPPAFAPSPPNTRNPPVTSGGHANPDPQTITVQVQVTVHKHCFFKYVNVVNWTSFIPRLCTAFQVERHSEKRRSRERIYECHRVPAPDRAVSARCAPRSGTASALSA